MILDAYLTPLRELYTDKSLLEKIQAAARNWEGKLTYIPAKQWDITNFEKATLPYYDPVPETISMQAYEEMCQLHRHELAVRARALSMAQSKIARLEAQLAAKTPPVRPSVGEVLAKTFRPQAQLPGLLVR